MKPDTLADLFALNLRTVIADLGLNYSAFADRVGLGKAQVTRATSGDMKTLQAWDARLRAVGVDPFALFNTALLDGERLATDEAELLELYRRANPLIRNVARIQLRALGLLGDAMASEPDQRLSDSLKALTPAQQETVLRMVEGLV